MVIIKKIDVFYKRLITYIFVYVIVLNFSRITSWATGFSIYSFRFVQKFTNLFFSNFIRISNMNLLFRNKKAKNCI